MIFHGSALACHINKLMVSQKKIVPLTIYNLLKVESGVFVTPLDDSLETLDIRLIKSTFFFIIPNTFVCRVTCTVMLIIIKYRAVFLKSIVRFN